MLQAVRKVCDETNSALKACGCSLTAEVVEENLTGDEGMDGYVLLDRTIAIYPQEVDGITQGVGWGVSTETVVPGWRSLGDPGYPDTTDVVDIEMPYVETATINGRLRFPRTYESAIGCAISAALSLRLEDWLTYGGEHERVDTADA